MNSTAERQDLQPADTIAEERSVDDMVAEAFASTGGRIVPGQFYDDVPDSVYHGGKGISKSGLDVIARQSPMHYQFYRQHPRPDTATFAIGRAFHALLLEPHKFADTYVLSPFNDFRTKEARTWRDAQQEAGKTVISGGGDGSIWGCSDWDDIHRMRDAVMAHPVARIFVEPGFGIAERSYYWMEPVTFFLDGQERAVNELCKCRCDWKNIAHDTAVDIKTTADASLHAFSRSVAEYRYDVQEAWYTHGMETCGDKVDAFLFLAVEKQPPYGVAIYPLDSDAVRIGAHQMRRDLAVYAKCRETDVWPGYQFEGVRPIELPAWRRAA